MLETINRLVADTNAGEQQRSQDSSAILARRGSDTGSPMGVEIITST